jgi:hypothetical protein
MSTTSTTDLNAIASAALGGVAYSGVATYYAALFTGASDGITGGTEASGGSYARTAVTNNQTNFPSASGGVVTSDTAITFPTTTAAYDTPTVNCVRLYDASSGGNMRFGSLLSPTATVDASGITVSIPVAGLTFTVASSA